MTLDRTPSFPPGTYRVSELANELKVFLNEVYPAVWVVGEIHRMRTSAAGHLYFELVEKGHRDNIIGRLDCALFRGDLVRVRAALRRSGQELQEGREVRCRGGIDLFPPSGRLQLIVREVDAVFSLGLLAQRRKQIVEGLRASGLYEANGNLAISDLPLRVGLVTSGGSAAHHDFVTSLEASGFGFKLSFAHASVQGQQASGDVVRALQELSERPLDCIALVRGGGARSDLAAFDHPTVAEAIARSRVPVLTGLGHETDRSIADEVAHSAFKTPTMVGEFLVARMGVAEVRLIEVHRGLLHGARLPLQLAAHRLALVEARVPHARNRIASAGSRVADIRARTSRAASMQLRDAGRRVGELSSSLAVAAPLRVCAARPRAEALVRRVSELSRARLRLERTRVETLDRLASELAPQKTLDRGFSITRREDGGLVRNVSDVGVGERLTTLLASGGIHSEVIGEADPSRPGGKS